MPSSELFEVLADPTRRLILEALLDGERAVGELVELVSIQQSGVSRHLRILGDAGFVEVRAEGTRRLYSLRPEPFRELDDWVGRYRSLWEERLDRFGQALVARRTARNSGPKKGRSE
ncbi:ArsR family transcriptional regulator [Sorangium cellulosum]|uniref:ArsR family transcriptional regulator n=2 Tax=Sorangium cellulosum TaxID=56 RepID=A0A150PH93_SORCE|nr:metalloregulator ArsR/SmtB family transcription factor [Sorangium cellulosum]AGP32146.1 ArsR family transcriptional regulator [Sorangium cellulosum So0157-2]KYF55006.1 ArsR family transcriptional regulator [Sorangium cellulosum]